MPDADDEYGDGSVQGLVKALPAGGGRSVVQPLAQKVPTAEKTAGADRVQCRTPVVDRGAPRRISLS